MLKVLYFSYVTSAAEGIEPIAKFLRAQHLAAELSGSTGVRILGFTVNLSENILVETAHELRLESNSLLLIYQLK